jgi:hypothetical protein
MQARKLAQRVPMNAALQQFDKDIKEKILRRLQGESATMYREEIEEIGVKAGLPKLRAAGEFMRLVGKRPRQ